MNALIQKFMAFHVDYRGLGDEEKQLVHEQYTDECLNRVNWISAVVFFGETILLILDAVSGFFKVDPLNYLNLGAEILVIVSSLMVNICCSVLMRRKKTAHKSKKNLMFAYKLCLFIAVGFFAFTDIYVRFRPLGAFIVFMFVFLVVPFYKWFENLLLFASYVILVSATYLGTVPNAKAGSLFSACFIFIAFYLASESMRVFLIKSIVNNRLNQLMTGRFQTLAMQSIVALSNTVEAKDLYTKGHSQRVATYSKEIAKRLGYDEKAQEEVYYIGLLHDIGKIGVPDAVINKNGRLTDEEFAEIKKHPKAGYDILKTITEIPDIGLGARWHHERYDGRGYPDGLAGNDIPPIARIIAVADAYDAMTSYRSYRDSLPQDVVREEIAKNIGKQFAPETGNIMLQMIDEDTNYLMREIRD